MQNIIALAGLFLLAGAKFVLSPGALLAYGLTKPETVIFCWVAGSFWSVVFFYGGQYLDAFFSKFSKKEKKLFTSKNRKLVTIKNKFGVIGLSLLIVLVSVPISAIISGKYFKHDKKAIPAYILSCGFWSVIVTYFSDTILNLF